MMRGRQEADLVPPENSKQKKRGRITMSQKQFYLVTDSTSDLPKSYFEENEIGIIHLSCLLNGEVYGKDKELDIKEFYQALRDGSLPTTSQINPEDAYEYFKQLVATQTEILMLAFSSGLSGSYQSVCIAAQQIMEEQENVYIEVVDTLCASLGEGLLVDNAVELRNQGLSLTEAANYIRENLLHLCHVFTVDDLFHLYRGGRVSKASAMLGTMINIKPLLHVDNEGHLINIGKVRGRKKSLLSLVDMMEERIGSYKDKQGSIFISHSDCREDAEFVAQEIKKRFGYDKFLIHFIGPVIGSHTGCGTVALFFWGEKR